MFSPELQTPLGVRERQEKSESRRAPEGGLKRENGPRHRANVLVLLFLIPWVAPRPPPLVDKVVHDLPFFDPALGVTRQFGRGTWARGNLCDWGSFAVLR